MRIDALPVDLAAAPGGEPRTPEEAAEQFEALLVRQFVEVMTKDLFESEGSTLPAAQSDQQRDAMTDALTQELVETGALRFRDLLLRQWQPGEPTEAPTDAPDFLEVFGGRA